MGVKKFELVIVGAGPAGAMAAKTAGELGIKTALIERKKSMADMRRSCTEAIGLNEENFGDVIYFNDSAGTFCFPRNGFTVPYTGPRANLYGFHLYTPGGNRVVMGDCEEQKKLGKDGRVGIVIDKGELVRGMLKEAEKNSVEILNNTNASEIKTEDDGVTVKTSAGDEFFGKYVIAADGANSRIVRLLGLNKKRKFMGTYVVCAWDFEGVEPPDPDAMVMIMGLDTSMSMCRKPEEGHFHISSGGYDPSLDLELGLENFMKEPAFAPWFKNAKMLNRRTACVVNMFEPIEKPYKDRVLLAGDAFWRQETSIMGAIMPGRKAAASVALALRHKPDDKNWIDEYLQWHQNFYYGPLGKGGGSMGDLKKILSRDDFDYLGSLVKKTLPATLKFYQIINNIGSLFGRMVPTIRQERPHILKNLSAVREMPEEEILGPRVKAGFPNR
jgi:digeranylgeranylglycerophospholipid reductase